MGKSKRENFRRLLWPIIALSACLLIVSCITGEFSELGQSKEYDGVIIGGHFFYQLFAQIPAFISCWFLVIRKNKSNTHIWINYLVWAVLWTIGRFS